MTFRKATREDVPRMAEIIEQAKAYFKQQGIPQWQDGYPNEVSLRADIAKGWSYVVCDETDAIVGTAAIMVADEPSYVQIFNGAWLTKGPYVTIHRIAVDGICKKRGIASSIVRCAEQIARENGCVSLRVDTHEINMPMQGMLRKNGFQFCGTIYLPDGAPRFAYEKPLQA